MIQPLGHNNLSLLNNQAAQFLNEKNPKQAIRILRTIIKHDPHNYPALANTGTAYKLLGKFHQAHWYYHQAAKINPNNPEIQYNLGQINLKLNKFKIALKHLLLSSRLGGNFAGLQFNIAVCYEATHQLQLALDAYQQVLAQEPDNIPSITNLVKLKQLVWDWPAVTALSPQDEKPYAHLLRCDDPQKNLEVAQNQSTILKSKITSPYSHLPPSSPHHRPLKIGYLSPDIGEHVISYHIHPLFTLHHRDQFQVFTYSYGKPNPSPYYHTIKTGSHVFRDCYRQSSASIASQIYSDQIDILVDLAGHTGNSQFDILAHRPAPIQAHYLGFPGSTGADYVDYLFTDKLLTPPHYQSYFAEKLVYLPDCFQINPLINVNPRRYTRKQCGLPENRFVFCSFNQPRKITPDIFSIWLQLLQQLPNSVLWLIKSNDIATQNMRTFASNHHVDPNRLIFAPFTEYDQHLDRLGLADLALDPTHYNGGSTTSDALLAKVPVITKTGNRYVSRISTSMLTCLGLTECITTSLPDYYQLALSLATHPDQLALLKQKIHRQKKRSKLYNPKMFVTNLESAYSTMWQRYLKNKPPQSFSVKHPS